MAKARNTANVIFMVKIKFPHKPEEVACEQGKQQVEFGLQPSSTAVPPS